MENDIYSTTSRKHANGAKPEPDYALKLEKKHKKTSLEMLIGITL